MTGSEATKAAATEGGGDAIIIIPARIGSTRLPRKLLQDLAGKTVLQRTYEQASKSTLASRVLVATDAGEIAEAVAGFGGEAVMTRADHVSGTERIAEAAKDLDADIVVNIQGDEPEIDPRHIDALIELQAHAKKFASTLACPFPADLDPAEPSAVKAIVGAPLEGVEASFLAEDFCRVAPAPRHGGEAGAPVFLHIGAYAFSKDSLLRFAAAPPSTRETNERLEQLRILEMGEEIAVRIVTQSSPGIDTPTDLEAARRRLSREI